MTFEKPEIFWGGNSTNSVKECLHRAEQLDCLQSVFDFCLFTAVVVYFAQSWSPTKQYSLSSLDIQVKLRQPTASFGYVDTAWQSAWCEVEPVITPIFFKIFLALTSSYACENTLESHWEWSFPHPLKSGGDTNGIPRPLVYQRN